MPLRAFARHAELHTRVRPVSDSAARARAASAAMPL